MSSTSNVSLPTKFNDTIVKIGDNEFNFDVILYNANKEFTRIKNSAIKELLINDNLLDFGHKGTIVFQNNLDNIEKVTTDSSGGSSDFTSFNSNNSKILPYYFRGDARDFLIVDIMPNLDSSENIGQNNNFEYSEKINDWYKLRFTFAIYDTEDILTEKIDQKYKKLYFWDSYYQLLTEKNSNFSTANFVDQKDQKEKKDIKGLSDLDRSIKTGVAVKKFLEDFFSKEEGFELKFSKDNWDEGSTNVFYSAPACNKGKDDLDYLTNVHVSDPNNKFDFSILRKERYTNELSFIPLSKYFQNAYKSGGSGDGGGKFHLEKFVLPNASDRTNDNGFSHIQRAPTGSENNAFVPDYGMIQQYQFHTISGIDQQNELVTTLVHSYDNVNKMFNIDTADNIYKKIYDVFKDIYTSKMKTNDTRSAASTLTKNEYRINNKNYKNSFSIYFEDTQKELRLSSGRNAVLRKALFLNNAITFTVRGMTTRRAARFISIDRNDSYTDNKFDDKLLGTYFVTNVNHKFTNGQYINEVTAIKPYLFKDPKNNDLVI